MNRLHSFADLRTLVVVAAAIVLGASVGFGRPDSKPAPVRADTAQELGLPSPEVLATDLLTEFQRVYNGRDGAAYAAMFDPWVFSYEFSPLDEHSGAPDAWNLAREVRAAQAMFADPKTSVVNLSLTQEDVLPASRTDSIPIDLDGVWKVIATVFLEVDREMADGSNQHHRVRGQLHEFYFRRGTEDEGRAWRIVYWRDMTGRRTLYSTSN